MSEKRSKKKLRKSTLLLWIIMSGILIFELVYVLIPYGFNLRRRINIKKDMESVYTDAEFVSVKCESKPTDKSEIEGLYSCPQFDVEIPEYDLYAFHISDSEGNTGKGYATKDGKVIFDTYAVKYYEYAAVESLKDAIDFEHNFPELDYYIMEFAIGNANRIVLTHDCTTFEGYKNAGAIVYFSFGNRGYPGLWVFVDDRSEETLEAIEAIKGLLADADFDMFVQFTYARTRNGISYVDDLSDISNGGDIDSYHPFEKSNEDAISDE